MGSTLVTSAGAADGDGMAGAKRRVGSNAVSDEMSATLRAPADGKLAR